MRRPPADQYAKGLASLTTDERAKFDELYPEGINFSRFIDLGCNHLACNRNFDRAKADYKKELSDFLNLDKRPLTLEVPEEGMNHAYERRMNYEEALAHFLSMKYTLEEDEKQAAEDTKKERDVLELLAKIFNEDLCEFLNECEIMLAHQREIDDDN